MNLGIVLKRTLFTGVVVSAAVFLSLKLADADPSKYPEFAQQKVPDNITPAFISVDQLFTEITAGAKPLIIDVRSTEEYHEAHIRGAVSSPLSEFSSHVKEVPRDRPVILY
jgi:3-mercaptopyruvate sulfurtransferase SseA